jgi:hypothetical protein
MQQLEMPLDEDVRLSHSSAQLLRSCERRYWHYKVDKTEVDPDYDKDLQSFAVGKVFHQVLEDNNHEKPEKIVNTIEAACEQHSCDFESIPMIHAMLLRYYEEHKKNKLEVVKCELKLDADEVIGFIDVIMKEPSGKWWIVDLKTYKSMYFVKPANLTMDYQLNLYSYFAPEIAKELQLDPLGFQGCILRVVTKPSLKQRKEESYVEYVSRMKESAKFYDIKIPKSYMNPTEVFNSHYMLYKKSLEMRKWNAKGSCNYNNCFSYNSPCPYYSKCHDGTYTYLQDKLS